MERLLLVVLGVMAVLVTGCVSASVAPLPGPPKVEVPPTVTTVPDFSAISVPRVPGTTTTLPAALRGGSAAIRGRVTVDGQPVAGADVRIDRFSGSSSVGTDVLTKDDGTYGIDGLLGGRYRVRAFHAPDATMKTPQVLFVGAGESRVVDLPLERFGGGTSVNANIAPDPPVLGELANVVVTVTTKGVDGSGVARSMGEGGVEVRLVSAGGRVITTPNPATTDGSGRATWTVRCTSLDDQGLSAALSDGTQVPLSLPACALPPTTTTATLTSVP